jgi:hypothetical protein
MRKTKESTSANDSVNLSSIKPVSAEQIRAVIKFLPIFEDINPEDLSRHLNNSACLPTRSVDSRVPCP